MTINYTPLLSLAEPVTGTQSGTWGDDVNQGLTDYLDIAIAGAQVISGSQTAVTLSKTTGSAAATNIAQVGSAGTTGTAQYAVINCTGNPASMLTITAPTTSKTYVVINSTSTSQPVKLVGVGPTTGVTVAAGQAALVAWKGTDFTLVATTDVSKLTGTLVVANGGTGQTTYTDGQLLIGNSTGNTLTKATLTAGTGVTITNGAGSITINGTTYGTATVSVDGLIKLGDATVQSVAANAVTATASRTYALQLNGSGQAVVNVPWTDTSSTAPGGSTTQVQYNNAGAFGGSANFTFDGTTVTTANDASISGLTVGKGAGSLDSNTAVGNGAFSSNTTGASNTAVGRLTLQLNLVGDNITAVGRGAAQHAKGSANTALGAYALQGNFANATGVANVGVGVSALNNFTTATNNIAIGDSAMYGVLAANENVGIGTTALSSTSGNRNVAIGYESGKDMTTGAKNVIIGSYTGNNGVLDIRASSNYVVLSDGDANVRAYWNGANATFNGNLNTTGTITQNSVAVVTTTGTQTLSNKTLDTSCTYNGTATGIAGGSAGQIPYQTGVGTTGFIAVGANGYLLQSLGSSSAPVWVQKTSANTANTVVNRDASGGFAVNQLEITTGYGITWDSGGASDPYQKYVSKTIVGNTASVMEFASPGLQYLCLTAGTAGPAGLWLDPSTGGTGQIGTIGSYNLNLYRDEVLYQTLDANGTVLASGKNLGLGGTSPATTGAGITFPATQSSSSNVNTLDDYEEGTFTPTVTGSTTSGTVSYGVISGTYTKVGRLVTFTMYVGWYNGFSGAGDLRLALPFACDTGNFFIAGTTAAGASSPTTAYPVSQGAISPGNAYININVTSGINTQMTPQAWAAFGTVNMTGFYYAAT